MDRREFVRSSLTATAASLLSRSATAAPGPRPNIILAMTDDQGWADVGYNSETALRTPVLDDMAATGLRFDRFYAAHPVCSPTRGSCLTGRHPNRYGCFSWGYDLPPEEITLAEVLRDAGYATGHFGKWHLGGIPPTPGREDRTNIGRWPGDPSLRHPGGQGFDDWFSHFNFFDLDPADFHSPGGPVGPLAGEGSELIVDRALTWLSGVQARRQPFFLVLWFGNPHQPHQALERDRALYPQEPPEQQQYLGEITALDRALGTLRQALRQRQLADDTLLWFCSDNGGTGPGNNGPLRGKKASLWEGGIRVPALIEWPGHLRQPRRTDVPAVTSDIFPTLLDLLELPRPHRRPLDGISLKPLLEGQLTTRPEPIGFQIRNARAEPQWAVWSDNQYKLHLPQIPRAGAPQLYDLTIDLGETRDLAADRPEVVRAMREQLDVWQASVQQSLEGADYR